MHLIHYINLVVLPLATLIYAQQDAPFYITSPLQGTAYKAGETATIRWINGVDEKAKVRLLQETGTSPLQPSGYEFTVQGDAGHHDWQTPSDLEPDASYALQFIYQGSDDDDDEPAFSYSGRFSITGGNATHRRSATSSSSTKVSTAVIPGATTSSTSSSSSDEKKSNEHSDSAKHQQQQQDHVTGAGTSLNPVALTILAVSSLFSTMAVSWSI